MSEARDHLMTVIDTYRFCEDACGWFMITIPLWAIAVGLSVVVNEVYAWQSR